MGRWPLCTTVDLGLSVESTLDKQTLWLVDQSLPSFFLERGRDCCRQLRFPLVDILIHFRDIRDQSPKLSEITRIVDFG